MDLALLSYIAFDCTHVLVIGVVSGVEHVYLDFFGTCRVFCCRVSIRRPIPE